MDSQEHLIKPSTLKRKSSRHLKSFSTMFHKKLCSQDAWRELRLVEGQMIMLRPSRRECRTTLIKATQSLSITRNSERLERLMPLVISARFMPRPKRQSSHRPWWSLVQKPPESQRSQRILQQEPICATSILMILWKRMIFFKMMTRQSQWRLLRDFLLRSNQELYSRISHRIPSRLNSS